MKDPVVVLLNKRRLLITLLRYEINSGEQEILDLLLKDPDLQSTMPQDRIQAAKEESICLNSVPMPDRRIVPVSTKPHETAQNINVTPNATGLLSNPSAQIHKTVTLQENYSQIINNDTSAEMRRLAAKLIQHGTN